MVIVIPEAAGLQYLYNQRVEAVPEIRNMFSFVNNLFFFSLTNESLARKEDTTFRHLKVLNTTQTTYSPQAEHSIFRFTHN